MPRQWIPDAPGPVVYANESHRQFGYEPGERLLIDGGWSREKGGLGTYFSYACNMEGVTTTTYGERGLTGRAMGLFLWDPAQFYDSPSGWGRNYRTRKVTSVRSAAEF